MINLHKASVTDWRLTEAHVNKQTYIIFATGNTIPLSSF